MATMTTHYVNGEIGMILPMMKAAAKAATGKDDTDTAISNSASSSTATTSWPPAARRSWPKAMSSWPWGPAPARR